MHSLSKKWLCSLDMAKRKAQYWHCENVFKERGIFVLRKPKRETTHCYWPKFVIFSQWAYSTLMLKVVKVIFFFNSLPKVYHKWSSCLHSNKSL